MTLPLVEEAFEIRAERVAHRPLRLFPLFTFVALQIVYRIPPIRGWWVHALQLSCLALFLAAVLPMFRRKKKGATVRVDDTWVFVDGVPIVRRDELTHVVARGGVDGKVPAVLLGVSFRNGAPIDVFFSHRADADALVSALGGGVGQAIARFSAEERSVSPLRVVTFSLAVVGLLYATFTGPYRALIFPFLVVVVFPVLAIMMRRRLTIGGDGIFIEPIVPRMFKSTFVSFAILDAVLIKDDRVSLVIDGQERLFSLPGKKRKKYEHAGASALVARIKEAQQRFVIARTNTDTRMVMGLVSRADRPVAAWLEAVRDLVDGPVSLSRSRISRPRERLLRVAENPRVDAEARAGAAAALAKVSDEDSEVKDRLRVAANVTADPALRRVLELAMHPDESGMVAALDEVPPSRRVEPTDTALDAAPEAGDKSTRQ